MGFEQIVDSLHYARFVASEGDTTFSVHLLPEGERPSKTVVYFETEKLDATVQRLEAAGFTFLQQPRDEPWLWREARLLDPSGNEICLYWAGENRLNPPWKMPKA